MAPTAAPLGERFAAKVDRDGPLAVADLGRCWLWTAQIAETGYGRIRVGSMTDGTRRTESAHRVAYELAFGPIPPGLTIDHLCRVRACVNPRHLEAVTIGENLRRSPLTLPGANVRKLACPSGHPYDAANTHRDAEGKRHCRRCDRDRKRARRAAC